jgi:hypothetical protein
VFARPAQLLRIQLFSTRSAAKGVAVVLSLAPAVQGTVVRLGHSRVTLTLDTYAHVTPHMQREAFGRFGQGFSSSS